MRFCEIDDTDCNFIIIEDCLDAGPLIDNSTFNFTVTNYTKITDDDEIRNCTSSVRNLTRITEKRYLGRVEESECLACPVGHECQNTNENKKACSKGHYQNKAKQIECNTCTGGHECPDIEMIEQIPCKAGFYNGEDRAHLGELCQICQSGHFCPARSAQMEKCPAGTFNEHLQEDSKLL